MEPEWKKRLRRAIAADGRSMRRISMDAGLGPNYLSQCLHETEPKSMGVDSLLSVLKELGKESSLHVISGFELDPQRDALVDRFLEWSPEEVEAALVAFSAFRDSLPKRKPKA